MPKKVICILSGGLGNQLFQYSAALDLARRYGAVLSLDTTTGFKNDQYQRSYELDQFFPNAEIESWFGSLLSLVALKFLKISRLLSRLLHFQNHSNSSLHYIKFGAHWIFQEFNPISRFSLPIREFSTLRLSGYFQSPSLFERSEAILLHSLSIYKPTLPLISESAVQLRQRESVAIGIRLYEETSEPELNAHNSVVKSLRELNQVLQQFLDSKPDCQVVIFCTHRSPLFNQLSLPSNSVFLTGDDNILSAHHTMWLMSQCKHHIFLNSSLYWWSAYLSRFNYDPAEQEIYAADNFINQSCYLKGWHRF